MSDRLAFLRDVMASPLTHDAVDVQTEILAAVVDLLEIDQSHVTSVDRITSALERIATALELFTGGKP